MIPTVLLTIFTKKQQQKQPRHVHDHHHHLSEKRFLPAVAPAVSSSPSVSSSPPAAPDARLSSAVMDDRLSDLEDLGNQRTPKRKKTEKLDVATNTHKSWSRAGERGMRASRSRGYFCCSWCLPEQSVSANILRMYFPFTDAVLRRRGKCYRRY